MAAHIAFVFVLFLLPVIISGPYLYGDVSTTYTGSSSKLWSSVCQLWPGLIQKYTASHSLHHATIYHIDYTSMQLPGNLQATIRIFLEVENLSPDAVMISNAITKIAIRRLLEKRENCITATLNQFIIEAVIGLFNHYLKNADDSMYNTFKEMFIKANHPKSESEELALRIVDRLHRATFRDIIYYLESVELGGLLQAVEDFRLDLYNIIRGQELSGDAAPQVNVLLPIVMRKLRALFQTKVTDCFSSLGLKNAYLSYLNRTATSLQKEQFILDITLFLSTVHGIRLSSVSIQTVVQIIIWYIDGGIAAISYYRDQLQNGFLNSDAPDVFTIEQVYYMNVLFYRLGWLAIPQAPAALPIKPQTSLADTYTRLIDEIIAQKQAVDGFTSYLKDKPRVEHACHVESIEFLQFLSGRVNDSLIHHLIPRKKLP